MTLGSQLAVAISETALPADQCRACQRQGLPILPLRRALVPSALNEQTQPDLQTNTQAGLRTLRAGYLYVLLDRTIWQAYQVTPDGYLRQFNPYTPPAANETPLSETCVSANHDAPASFLNIDTLEHSTAWLAFASDPWPTSVLDAYKRTEPSALRFHKLDLASARNAPSSVGLAMTVDNLQVDQQVYEYQQHPSDSFNSVHGFYSRATRLTALQGFLRNTIPRHELQQGVLAIVLDDTIGLAQEQTRNELPGSRLVKRRWRNPTGRTNSRPRKYCWRFVPCTLNGRKCKPDRSPPSPVTAHRCLPTLRSSANVSLKKRLVTMIGTWSSATTNRCAPNFKRSTNNSLSATKAT